MASVLTHALLGLSVAALAGAALRAAALAAPSGLARVVAAAPLAAATAVAEALVLGLVALGTNPPALAIAAGATWVAARAWLPAPAMTLSGEVATWWRARTPAERGLIGALVGAGAAWAGWQLVHPALGFDTVHYHLPEIAIWIERGTPASLETVIHGLPVANYPITNEVLLAWAGGIGRGLEPLTLWPWLAIALTGASGWLGLRSVRVPGLQAGLATAAVCLMPPIVAWQANGAMTDGPALAWLAACAALCAASREHPTLLAPALVAAALAVGTKTTTAPAALLVLALAGWAARGRLRSLRTPLLAGLALGTVAGGSWYLRNLVQHGSPFWPLVASPWGDPVPDTVNAVNTTFLDRPRATLDAVGELYLERLAAGLLLVGAGILAPLVAPRRGVIAAAGATLAGLLLWTRAPLTGISPTEAFIETTFSTTRYLLPVVATGAVAVALAAREGGRVARIASGGVLGAAALLAVVQTLDLGFPVAPGVGVPLAGAVVGALVALALRSQAGPLSTVDRRLSTRRLAASAVTAALLGAALALPASNYVERQAETVSTNAAGFMGWLADQPGYADGDEPVAFTPTIAGTAAGDRITHPIELIDSGESCDRIAQRARRGYVVVYVLPLPGVRAVPVQRCLGGRHPDYHDPAFAVYRPVGGGAFTPGRSRRGVAAGSTRAATSGVTRIGRSAR